VTRERLVTTAVAIADADGIQHLSMRKLAQELGVEAMSLYHHVANKEALLDAMVDSVFAEIEVPTRRVRWRNAMRRRAICARDAMLRHHWALGLMESRSQPGPHTLRHHDAVIGVLRRAGFTVAQAASAFSLLDSYVYGFVLQESALPFGESAEKLHAMGDAMLAQMPANEFPYFIEMISDHALRPGYSYGREFLVGLDLILAGLQRELAAF
jgi:AcrR family transcriptional regulator